MKKLIPALLFIGVFASCYNDKEELLYPASFGACDSANANNYAAVKTLLNARCASSGCHVAGATAPDLSTYTGVFASKDRVQTRACIDKTMPQGTPLSACEIGMLNHWIAKGAPEN